MSTLEAHVADIAPAYTGAQRWKRVRHFVVSHPLFVTVLAVNLVGDGIRDLLDPKHQEFK